MAKSQLAFDIATQTPTTFSVDHKGVLSRDEIISDREGDALVRSGQKELLIEFAKLKATHGHTFAVRNILDRHDQAGHAIAGPRFSTF